MIQIPYSDMDEYRPGRELLAAINVALFLKRPLFLSGDPGTGKTECAAFVARRLHFLYPQLFTTDQVLRFDTKSGAQSTDLFYHYDAVAHFGDKSNKEKEAFISFNSVGIALLGTNPAIPALSRFNNYTSDVLSRRPSFASVVLIDEIDKAPRDFPNDLLSELEKPPFKFGIKELPGFKVEQDINFPVLVIITSNNEKGLPDAFLRRCVFHHIAFPSAKDLLEIVKSNLKNDHPYFEAAVEKFIALRQKNLVKKPSTSELIDWIACLHEKGLLDKNLADWRNADEQYRQKLIDTLGIIAKSKADFETVRMEISG